MTRLIGISSVTQSKVHPESTVTWIAALGDQLGLDQFRLIKKSGKEKEEGRGQLMAMGEGDTPLLTPGQDGQTGAL